ncbi:hypothetical protein BO94DRAFT_572318 [Aspergillus sclerotioniger CBS 115572]|uniref:Xylanolytic transcriptional activator regulatory domain-containing protein n=1 Tax=Aspergillus sclerotioniger CBS 115572 TaxID=1450535 RepID=A0A317XAV7_9EURO|nr:hypothetical protein BO94DRAFT_572318 [Aspergillus sclerotioniger CBS 115572]PWY94772.1 hypothetical protein BO94DRAFT_572318 [Aspergillus sclerotioniger CBS 115572]
MYPQSTIQCIYKNNNKHDKIGQTRTVNNNSSDDGSNAHLSESGNPDLVAISSSQSGTSNEGSTIDYGMMLKVFAHLGSHSARTAYPCESLDQSLLDMGLLQPSAMNNIPATRSTSQPLDMTPLWTPPGLPSTNMSSHLPSPPIQPTLGSLALDGGFEGQTPWPKLSAQHEGLRSSLRAYAGQEAEVEGGGRRPEDETFQWVMEAVGRLEQSAQQQCQRRASLSLHSRPPTRPLTAPAARDFLPPRPRCDALLNAFLETYESVLRILDRPTFRKRYESFWERSASQLTETDEDIACQLLLIVVLGNSVCLQPNALGDLTLRREHASWIVWVKQWVEQKTAAGEHAHLGVAQIVCLLTLTRNTQHQRILSDYDPVRIGIRMSLHREPRPSRSSFGSNNEVELRRRLWATMMELSLQLCLDEGLPPPLAPETYDSELPSSLDDELVDIGFGTTGFTSSTVLVLLARTQRLRLRILHTIHTPMGIRTYEQSEQLATELIAACDANLKALRDISQPQSQSQSQPTDFQIKMLDIFTRPFVLALYNPYANETTDKPASYYSRQMRMETAALLLTYPLRTSDLDAVETTLDVGLDLANSATCTGTGATTTEITEVADPYEALRVHSHTRCANVQRQAAATLVLDLISELEENPFPTLHGSSRKYLRGVVGDVARVFKQRMQCAAGMHSMGEFMLFAAGAAYIDVLLGSGGGVGDEQDTVAHALIVALGVCTEVAGLDTLSLPLDSYLGC